VLEKDQIHLGWSDGRFLVHYYDHHFPVDPATIPAIGDFAIGKLESILGTSIRPWNKSRGHGSAEDASQADDSGSAPSRH
jgi:maltooligosyltrehalose synthase